MSLSLLVGTTIVNGLPPSVYFNGMIKYKHYTSYSFIYQHLRYISSLLSTELKGVKKDCSKVHHIISHHEPAIPCGTL